MLNRRLKINPAVIPAQAGISMQILVGYGKDSGLRRNDTF